MMSTRRVTSLLKKPAFNLARPALRRDYRAGTPLKKSMDIVHAEVGTHKLFHKNVLALLVLTPVAIFSSPSIISKFAEVPLAVLFPMHLHLGLNAMVADYVPRPIQEPSRYAVLAISAFLTLGLLKVTVTGPGLTETLKALWKKPEKKEVTA